MNQKALYIYIYIYIYTEKQTCKREILTHLWHKFFLTSKFKRRDRRIYKSHKCRILYVLWIYLSLSKIRILLTKRLKYNVSMETYYHTGIALRVTETDSEWIKSYYLCIFFSHNCKFIFKKKINSEKYIP